MKIFLSCVSTEFRSYRLKIANQLGALKGQPHKVKVQEDFQQGGHTLLEHFADYVRNCDLVIHLVGDASGARPTPEHERSFLQTLGETDPASFSGWSYTQWEYHIARRFQKKVLVYLAKPEASRDCGWPIHQGDDDTLLQQSHILHICNSGEHRKEFTNHLQLVREVFHDLGLEPNLKVNNLPYKTLGTLFKGRDDFLEKIRTTLSQAEYRGHQRVANITASATAVSVHGLGGIGKTRAAIEFAHKHADDYTALLFVRADSPEGLKANLGALCGPSVLDLAEKDAKELDIQVAAVLQWLKQHPGWLLIFDNVDTEQAARSVEGLLGQLSGTGQILITSRISCWSGSVESLALNVLTEVDAANFLLERTAKRRRKQADDLTQANLLAVTLGQLALALEQAGAMIETNRMSFIQYHEQWQTQHDRVLTWFNERLMQYPLSVAVTWQTSFDQLTEPARRLLYQLAWFSPDPIPESLLDVTVEASTLDDSGDRESAEIQTDRYGALTDLEAYSLVTRAEDTFSIHRLVQDVTRRSLQGDREHNSLTAALEWIDKAFVGNPDDVRSWSKLDPLAPHARTCVQFADKAHINEPTTRLMNQIGFLFYSKAQYIQAEPLMRRALAIDEQSYGENHPIVAIRLNNLGQLLQDTNQLKEAEQLMRRALAIDELYYGENHPKVAIRLKNYGHLLQTTNRLTEAEQLMRRALAINEHSYWENHSRVALDLNNLAQLLQATNRLKEAEPLMWRALAIVEQSYGINHPNVANCLNNLGMLLQTTNRLKEAEQLMRRALAIDELSYGENHPRVAIHLNNLAQVLKATNRLKEAMLLMRRTLYIDEQNYGKNHPIIAMDLNNLAELLKVTNRLKEAEPLMRQALAIDEQSYRNKHTKVAIDLNNLAVLLWSTNRLEEAEPLMRRALLIDKQSYGKNHPKVAIRLNNLAQLFKATNRLKRAELLMRRALAIDEKSYEDNHPAIAIDLNNLAKLLLATNRLNEAEPLMYRGVSILLDFNRRNGYSHPNMYSVLNNFAQLLLQMGLSQDNAVAKIHKLGEEYGIQLGKDMDG